MNEDCESVCPRCRQLFNPDYTHRCADGFLMVPGQIYRDDGKHLCEICHKPFNGIGYTCSTECFELRQAQERQQTSNLARSGAWFRKSANPRINSFESRLTSQDRQFLHDLKIGIGNDGA